VEKCVEYLELISAHADGELSEFDSKRVEEHLDTCENCSALLDLYSDLSAAIVESTEPAPEELCSGVMEKIRSDNDNVVSISDIAKKRSITRIVLSRYVPIAACLALVLLTLPRVFNINRSDTDMANEGGLQMMSEMAINRPITGGGGSGGAAQSGGANAPAAAPPAAASDSFYAGDDGTGRSSQSSPFVRPGGADASAPAAESVPSSTPTPSPLMPSAPEPLAPGSQAGAADPMDEPEPEVYIDSPESPLMDDGELYNEQPPGYATGLLREFNDAFALFEITGELPDLLASYEPEPATDELDWEMLFIIPRAAALELLEILAGNDSVSIIVNIENSASDYAIVLYSSSG